jgi:UDP-N-acetylmuramoyl-tripeptide--D-alanyl-D-alanine ligase
MPLADVAEVVGGSVHDDPGVTVTGPAFVDSRLTEPGGLFVAVAGEHADGHDFASSSVRAGAAAVLGSRPTGVPTVVVADVAAALAALARHVLSSLPRIRVVAVTGSQGKTTTKDLLTPLLGRLGKTVATVGSFNNELGLPLTVLRVEPRTDYLLLEMGARGRGHLRELCGIAPPHVSVVLNVGKAHLGEFGSREAIAQAKGEIVEALPADGTAVLNLDDPLVSAMTARTSAAACMFGTSPRAEVRVTDLTADDTGRSSFRLHAAGRTAWVRLQLVGQHHALNAAAAAAAALTLGLSLEEVAQVLSATPAASRWRMEVRERGDGLTLINDAYNANPESMAAALTTLATIGRRAGRRTVAVLGEMCELGESSETEHAAVGTLSVRLGIDRVLVVGEAARQTEAGARAAGAAEGACVVVPDRRAAVAWLERHLAPTDVVLVKASRAAGLEKVADALLSEASAPGSAG